MSYHAQKRTAPGRRPKAFACDRRGWGAHAEFGEALEDITLLTPFTVTSPTARGVLPSAVSRLGGVVLDLVGLNGRRVVSQLPANQLFSGYFNNGTPVSYQGNPGVIGIQSGFTPALLTALGGGFQEVAIRLTLLDGDTATGNFDHNRNTLLVNGLSVGDFSAVATEQTSNDGLVSLSLNPQGGFRNNFLDTGFFYTNDSGFLTSFYAAVLSQNSVTFALLDDTPYDNFLDFTVGLNGDLIGAGVLPILENLPPVVTGATNNSPVAEGQSAVVGITATDPDGMGAPVDVWFDLDDNGSYETLAPPGGTVSRLYPQDGAYAIKYLVRDFENGETLGVIPVTVTNVAPVVQAPAVTPIATAGAPAVFALGDFTDPGLEPSWSLQVDWGDGSAPATATVNAPGALPDLTHTFSTPGTYNVTVKVSDDDSFGFEQFTVVVANAAPVYAPPVAQAAFEGTPVAVALGAFQDPGVDPDGSWLVTVDWGDLTPAETFVVLSPGDLGSRFHTYARDGDYRVAVTVDDGADADHGDFLLTAANVAPHVTPPAPQNAVEGVAAPIALGGFADPGSESDWRVTVDWGDGTPLATFTATTPGNLGTLAHAYAQDGTYRGSVTVDDGRDRDVAEILVYVRNDDPVLGPPDGQTADEGLSALFALGQFTDTGAEPFWTVTVNWGDGSPFERFEVTTLGDLGQRPHTYRQDGVYPLTITVEDDDSAVSASTAVDVRNIAPVIANPSGATALEGTASSLDLGGFFDPGAEPFWTVSLDWGDGTPLLSFTTDVVGDLGAQMHVYAQDGVYTVRLRIGDDDTTSLAEWPILVTNVAPVLTPGPPVFSDEGDVVAVDLGAFVDPGAEPFWRVAVDWGDGSERTEFFADRPGALGVVPHVYPQDGTFSITVTAYDDDVASDVRWDAVVSNRAPVVTAPAEQSGAEGQLTAWDLGMFADPGRDAPWRVNVNWGDGSPADSWTTDQTGDLGLRAHRFLQDGAYLATITVSDDHVATNAQFLIRIANVAPVISPLPERDALEGILTSLDLGTFADPGAETSWSITLDWGDGSPTIAQSLDAPGPLGVRSHTYAQDGVYPLVVTVTDDDVSVSRTTLVRVANVSPEGRGYDRQTATEGLAATFQLGRFSDPGSEPFWRVNVAWGDGSVDEFITTTPEELLSGNHRYEQNGLYTVRVRIQDDDSETSWSQIIDVANVAPVLIPPADAVGVEGSPLELDLGRLMDPGRETAWFVTVDPGDGSVPESFFVNRTGDLGTFLHTFAQDGTYFPTVTVADDRDVRSVNAVVVIRNQAPVLNLSSLILAGPVYAEGEEFTLFPGTFTDPGLADSWTLTADWGDGSAPFVVSPTAPGPLPILSHRYLNDGNYPVTLTLSDDRESVTAPFAIRVTNTAPVLTVNPLLEATDEGVSTVWTLGGFADPGAEAFWTVTVDWGDGSAPLPLIIQSGDAQHVINASHAYVQDGRYSVRIIADDGVDNVAQTTLAIVRNTAPILTRYDFPTSVTAGDPSALNLAAFDPGRYDSATFIVNWGDGAVSVATRDPASASDFLTVMHAYALEGVYAVTVTVADESGVGAGGFGLRSVAVAAAPRPLETSDSALDALIAALPGAFSYLYGQTVVNPVTGLANVPQASPNPAAGVYGGASPDQVLDQAGLPPSFNANPSPTDNATPSPAPLSAPPPPESALSPSPAAAPANANANAKANAAIVRSAADGLLGLIVAGSARLRNGASMLADLWNNAPNAVDPAVTAPAGPAVVAVAESTAAPAPTPVSSPSPSPALIANAMPAPTSDPSAGENPSAALTSNAVIPVREAVSDEANSRGSGADRSRKRGDDTHQGGATRIGMILLAVIIAQQRNSRPFRSKARKNNQAKRASNQGRMS